jgi:hypothetical protein
MSDEVIFSWEGREYKYKHVKYEGDSRWTVIENMTDNQRVAEHHGWVDKSIVRTIVAAYDRGFKVGETRGASSTKAKIYRTVCA